MKKITERLKVTIILLLILSSVTLSQNLPLVVDNSAWFPPVRSQQVLPDCTHFSLIYYLKSSIWNRNFNRDPLLEINQFNHNFVWNQDGGFMATGAAASFMMHQGCVSVSDFPINEQTSERIPSMDIREKALRYKTKNFSTTIIRGAIEGDSILISQQLSALKDSLKQGHCFSIGLKLYNYFFNMTKENNIYNCYKGISYDSVRFGHEVCIIGYNDTIRTAEGRGAFLAINSNLDYPKFYLDYNWFFYSKIYFFCTFIEEDFYYKPELTLNLSLKSALNSEERTKYIITDTIFVNRDGQRFEDYTSYFDNQGNHYQDFAAGYLSKFLQLRKINGKTIPAQLNGYTTHNLLFLPYNTNNDYSVFTDITKYVKADSLKSLELLVCDPISASYSGIVCDSTGHSYTGPEINLYSYSRNPNIKIPEAYIRFLGTDKRIVGKVIEWPDTTVTCYNYYSASLFPFIKPPTNNYALVKKSVSKFKRKLVTFDVLDTLTVDVENYITSSLNNFTLNQNYPNPFNPSTTISYSIPKTSLVTIKIIDIIGREVATLVSEEKPFGNYEVLFDGKDLPSSVYFYRLQAGSFTETKKLVLMK